MAKSFDIATHTRALTADGSDNLVATNELQVSTIDTTDSSAITVTPSIIFAADASVQNNLNISNSIKNASDQIILPATLGTPNYVLKVNASGTGAEWAVDAGGGGGGSARTEEFPTVTNGSADVTMGAAYTLDQLDVYLNGARMRSTTDYTVSGTTLTFAETLTTGDIVAIYAYDTAENLITGNWSDLNDVSVTGAATNTMVRFDGTNYVAASTTEDASGNLSLGDNAKINFGASNDLEIFHDGSHSYITDTGTGQLRLRASSAMVFQNAGGTQGYATFNENGAVQLYYNGTVKFETASTGVDVTGDIVASNGFVKSAPSSGGVSLTYNDGGGNASVTFNHTSQTPDQNGNSGRITVNTDSTTGAAMTFQLGENVTGGASTVLTNVASFTPTAQTLNYSGSAKIATSSTGVTVTGAVTDSVGDVRIPRRTVISTATTIADEGVYYCTSNPTLTLGAPAGGTIMTIYNNSASNMTLNRGSTLSNMRIGADNNTTNKTSVTLGGYSTTTITIFEPTALAVVTGTDVT